MRLERDPLALDGRVLLANLFIDVRRFEEAIVEAHAGIELDPGYPVMYAAPG